MLKSLIRGKFIGSRSVNNPPEHFVNNQVLTVGIRPYAAGEGEKPRLRFCSRGKIYPCFFRFSELLARTAEVIWMKSLTYFFTFSPLR